MNNSFQSLIDNHPLFRTHIFRSSSHSHHKLSTKTWEKNFLFVKVIQACSSQSLLPSKNLVRLLALSSLNLVLIILTTCLHLSNQTRKFFGKLPTPSYIYLFLLRHAALQKLSILWIPLVAFLKRKSLLFTNLCQCLFRAAQTLFYQTIKHHSLIFHLSILKKWVG